MEPLSETYKQRALAIGGAIQSSDLLAQYLDDEEEDQFKALFHTFEPQIAEIYNEVASIDPLQIIAFEELLLDESFEGLFLPKILGYSVLRGELNEHYKYIRPQEHFKNVLSTICHSSNFEYLKHRIGQSVQIGLSLSSDIWVTNLINHFTIKRVKQYLQTQKNDGYRNPIKLRNAYLRYKNQFKGEVFLTAQFPATPNDLPLYYPSLKSFLISRILNKNDNSSIYDKMLSFLDDDSFHPHKEHLNLLIIFSNFFDLNKKDHHKLVKIVNTLRIKHENFSEYYLKFLLEMYEYGLPIEKEAYLRMYELLDQDIKDDVLDYYELMDAVHKNGFHQESSIEAIRNYYINNEGLSINNECVRKTILYYVDHFLSNIPEEDYTSFFELSKIFPAYMSVFSNQKYNLELKAVTLRYVKRLLKRFTDKRGKDYQDIKKFVSGLFLDLGFMNEKQIVELFKTKRKRRVTANN